MAFFTFSSIIPKSISTLLIAVLIANLALFAAIYNPAPAQAQWIVTDVMQIAQNVAKYAWDAAKWVYEKAADAADAAYKAWEKYKSSGQGIIPEMVMTLLNVMMNQMLNKITNDIVAWINGGGKGKLRVLQDPGKFLTDALDEAGGVLAGAILNVDPTTLCDASYLKFKLKAAFTGPYAVPTFDEKVACTFTGAAEGLRKFQEDFTNGGWASFIELSRKENNQIGQTLIIANEASKLEVKKKEEAEKKMDLGKGYIGQEKCTVTKAPVGLEKLEGKEMDEALKIYQQISQSNILREAGKVMSATADAGGNISMEESVLLRFGNTIPPSPSNEELKAAITAGGGNVSCKIVTPGEQIGELATKSLVGGIDRLEAMIAGTTSRLGSNAGSTLKPYLTAIATAGVNLLINKGYGLISNALAPQQKPRKARRQSTTSLQENTMLAQSAGALAASMNDFRSFLLKAMLEFSLYVSNATTALNTMDVLGRTPINKGEAELRGGTWEFGGGCPAGYDKGNLITFSNAPYSCAYDADAVTTNHAGKTFFEEANWCGAYYQEIPMVTEKPPAVITMPVENPVNIVSIATTNCPRIVYFTPGTGTEITQPGVCNAATNQVTYDLNGDGTPEMITQLASYDDRQTGQEDRFIRKNTVGALDASGIPANIGADSFVFEETLADSRRNVNHNSILDTIATSTPGALQGLFEMRPYYTNAVTAMATTIATPRLPQGLAQAAVANDYVFGGYNQFGHSNKVFRLSTGALVASLPIALSGSAAVYYPPNGRIYLFGGFDSAKAYATIWEFNPVNQTLRTMSARLPAPATGLAAAYYSPNGRIYLFGGSNDGVITDQILEYNQATDTLVTKFAKFPSPVAFAAAAPAAINPPINTQQRIYIFGGILAQGFSSGAIFEYNPAAADDESALKRKSADIAPRGFIAASPASANAIMLAGGQSEYGVLATVEQYNAQNDSLTQMPSLAEPRSKAAGGIIGGVPVLVGGVMPIPAATAVSAESAKLFSQGDIYHIPAAINGEEVITPFWQKYFSSTFEDGSTTLLNTRTDVSYNDFTATVRDPAIATITNADSNLVWMSPPFYPELFEKIQELMEKSRIIEGYNYPVSGVKNYQSGLADQLGATPDDDPYDNNPSNPRFFERDVNGNAVIEEQLGDWEGYKGSVTDTLNKYNNLTQVYQVLFGGLADENALEGVDKDLTILSPTETNIKLALIGSRCPALPPSATSTPDLVAKCPRFGSEYNMARRFIFEADDTGANPQGITTGFATNPFTGEKSSSLAGLLNLDEMTTQLQSLPPDRNIIKLIRLRQLLEQLQVAPIPIQVPGKAGTSIIPAPLSGVDLIVVSLPGYEHIQAHLNDATTKNLNIQTLIEAYGYTNAKDAYPEISKHLDEIFDDVLTQITDDIKETFLKRIEEQLEDSKIIAQHRLRKFLEYTRDINGTVKLEMSKQRGDQLAGLSGVDVAQLDSGSSVLRINAEDMFVNNGQKINVLLSRTPLRLTNDERNGIIGSAIYKIKTISKFLGVDITTAEFSTRMSQYMAPSGTSLAEREADLDQRVKNVLKDVYMYYTGIFNQTDEMLPPSKRNIIASCGQDAVVSYFCDLTTFGANRKPTKIYKDARTKLEELQNDFSLMVEEITKVSEEYRTLMANISSQKNDLDELVKLLSNLHTDYDQGNACVGLSTNALWSPPSSLTAVVSGTLAGSLAALGIAFGASALGVGAAVSSGIAFIGLASTGILAPLAIVGAVISWFISKKKRKKAREEAARRRAAIINKCKDGINNYNKHLGQLADQFICNKINPKYE